jgi:hypothetical protein
MSVAAETAFTPTPLRPSRRRCARALSAGTRPFHTSFARQSAQRLPVDVQGLRPDLYFVIELATQATTATVFMATSKPRSPGASVAVRVVSWANEGGNIFDDSLGDAMLENPTDAGQYLRWSGFVAPPFMSSFDKVAVELDPLLDFSAYDPPPQTGGYALIDFTGFGVGEQGEWISAVLNLWVQCRGKVGQVIPCHGLSYVVAPEIALGFLAQRAYLGLEEQDMHNDELTHFASPQLYLGRTLDGWRYRAPAPGEYARWRPLEELPTHGPFASAEDAARDAVVMLNLRPGVWLDAAEAMGGQIGQALAAVRDALEPRQGAPTRLLSYG